VVQPAVQARADRGLVCIVYTISMYVDANTPACNQEKCKYRCKYEKETADKWQTRPLVREYKDCKDQDWDDKIVKSGNDTQKGLDIKTD
jgi:hypothetical protein